MDVPTCRVCGVAVVEVLDWGRDLYGGLCGGCGYRKEVLRARGDTCEWCSERLEYSAAEIRSLDRGRVRAEQAGWLLGYRTTPGVGVPPLPTFDLCPACASLRPPGSH
jgi:hypothetical protein